MRCTVEMPFQAGFHCLRLLLKNWLEVFGEETTMGSNQVRDMEQEIFRLWFSQNWVPSFKLSSRVEAIPCQAYLLVYHC